MTRLRIQLLGSFQLYRDECLIAPEEWPGRKAQQLLKILLTCRGHATLVDQLFEWLWPDLPPASARNSLWVAITHLRRVLEPDLPTPAASVFILTSPAAYRFDSAGRCGIDVDDFLEHHQQGQAAVACGDQAAAIAAYCAAEALYRGDYLAGDRYEEWAIPTREHLRETFLDVESALAAQYLDQQREREALVRLHRVLEQDACRESAWRLAMECYYRAGELGQALRAFEQCRAALARELGVDPLPETVALHERILRSGIGRQEARVPRRPTTLPPAPPLSPLSPRLPFVGREKEWPALSHLLHEVIRGRGRVVFVRGEPGIGKTRLLEELAGLAVVRGARVLAGSCYELEQNLAYAPILEALRSILPPAPSLPRPSAPRPNSPLSPRCCPSCATRFPTSRPISPCRRMRSACACWSPSRSSSAPRPRGSRLPCCSMTFTGPIHRPCNCCTTWGARFSTSRCCW